jgi:hypothetical protein
MDIATNGPTAPTIPLITIANGSDLELIFVAFHSFVDKERKRHPVGSSTRTVAAESLQTQHRFRNVGAD